VKRRQYVQYLRRRGLSGRSPRENALSLMRTQRRNLPGLRSTLNGQTKNGMRSSGVTRCGHNLEDIHCLGSNSSFGKRFITRIIGKEVHYKDFAQYYHQKKIR
jgi:hypothetical protein